jgi:endonuclease/exonuclease/phosphatase (EEP) superfamily protein YafD
MFGGGIPGKGILSVYPLHEVEQVHLYPGRPDLRATIRLAGRSLSLLVAHPPPRNFRRGFRKDAAAMDQIATLIELAVARPPAILLGDFNITRYSRHYARLAGAGLADAFSSGGRGPGATLPTRVLGLPLRPVARVDYIWHTADLETLEGWVGDDSGSDHRPVLARLRLQSCNGDKPGPR